jgi:hypothetical protein
MLIRNRFCYRRGDSWPDGHQGKDTALFPLKVLLELLRVRLRAISLFMNRGWAVLVEFEQGKERGGRCPSTPLGTSPQTPFRGRAGRARI